MQSTKKIHVLSREVSQLIAAGEVVERPASVVKELLENSIDAGAARIEIEINNGGIKLIRITDNGHGIFRQDIKDAFLRHATSKLSSAEDLNNIDSLGFRGEALASICAVSRVEVITRHKEEPCGTHFFIHAGEPQGLRDVGRSVGTTISVKDLFYNTPARMKFLKKDIAEANAVAGVVDKIALSHPEVSFKFTRDGKEALTTPGGGSIESAVYSVYGKEFFEGLMPVGYELNNIKVNGFISKPLSAKSTRSMQNFFINGRYVKSQVMSSALEESFKNVIMAGKHPYCVIYLSVVPGSVDVNVHPAKMEVKFSNEKLVFDAIYYAAKTALMASNSRGMLLGAEMLASAPLRECSPQNFNVSSVIPEPEKEKPPFLVSDTPKPYKDFLNLSQGSDFEPEKNMSKERLGIKKAEDESLDVLSACDISKSKLINQLPEGTLNNINPLLESVDSSLGINPEEIKIIGEVFNCYIILQKGESEIILVDKHAAHERLIYEKIKKSNTKIESQGILEPLIVVLEKEEYCTIIENLDLLEQAGYHTEDFGPGTIMVRSVPVHISLSEAKDSISEIAGYLLNNKKNINTQKLDWLYSNMACRAAIKSGKSSSYIEVTELIKKLINNPSIRYCPHGRPVYISFTKKFIEKEFGRT